MFYDKNTLPISFVMYILTYFVVNIPKISKKFRKCGNMKKFLEIKGLSVVDSGGNTRGIVEDGVIDTKNNRICSLIIIKKGMMSSHFLLSLKNIECIGNTIIANEEIYDLERGVLRRNKGVMMASYIGREILDCGGRILGNLSDLIFDEESGQIRALILTRGLLEDITQGRRIILADEKTSFGEERIMVSENYPEIINDASFKKFLE